MLRRRGPATLALLLGLLALAAHPAAAQQWYERYTKGLALEGQGQWGPALVEFEAANALKPIPAKRAFGHGQTVIVGYDPHYHMALCLIELRRPGLAVQQLKMSVRARVTPAEKLVALRNRIGAMKEQRTSPPAPTAPPAIGHLVVESDPPGVTIFVDEAARGAAPLAPLPLSPGVHVVRAEAPGFRTVERHVTVAQGDTTTLVIALVATAPVAPTRPPTAPTQVERLTPTLAAPPPTPTQVVAQLPIASPPAPPPPVRTIEIPAGRSFPKTLAALAILVVLAFTAVLRLRSIRRRRPSPLAPTTPTRGLDQATTLAETGAKLGEYELQGVLGRGGMATTFRARRPSDGQTVAVKVPHDACLADETFVARFLREGKLGEQLHHPGIVRVLAAGEEKGRPYLAMELITGRTLKEELRAVGSLPLRRALEIARDIAEALDYAHAKGVVHRDLKPENVMILPDSTVKVMDFGIARVAEEDGLTSSNIFLGTPLYAAPEMVDPKRVDHRVDLYSLGIILYEMLEGAVPFTADSPYRVLEMHQRTPLPPREQLAHRVPERVWSVVTRLCEKSPEARCPSAEALLVELNHLLHDFPDLEGGDVF